MAYQSTNNNFKLLNRWETPAGQINITGMAANLKLNTPYTASSYVEFQNNNSNNVPNNSLFMTGSNIFFKSSETNINNLNSLGGMLIWKYNLTSANEPGTFTIEPLTAFLKINKINYYGTDVSFAFNQIKLLSEIPISQLVSVIDIENPDIYKVMSITSISKSDNIYNVNGGDYVSGSTFQPDKLCNMYFTNAP